MRLAQRLGDLGGHLDRLGRGEWPLRQACLEGLPGHILHDDAGAPADVGNLVDLADERMIERRRRLCLALEQRQGDRIAVQRLGQELDGDLAFELRVVGKKHLTHPALAQAREDAIARRRNRRGMHDPGLPGEARP